MDGGNTGIGYETAKALAAQGFQTVIACRDSDKAAAAKQRIREEVRGAKVESLSLDLADLQSVRDLANRCLDMGHPLDVLINNAGVMACPEMRTRQGHEYQLGVNHLGHYLLTLMLLPLLQGHDRTARIVNVSSAAHQFGHILFEDPDFMASGSYDRWKAYGQSKLANCLFTYELARRLPANSNITVNTLHPGVVQTELSRFLFNPTSVPIWQRPLLQGAETSIWLAQAPVVEHVTSKYFVNCKPVTTSKESYDTDVARRLWELSAQFTGTDGRISGTTSGAKESVETMTSST
eukprot:jgi/Astpho2/4610/Aster-00184